MAKNPSLSYSIRLVSNQHIANDVLMALGSVDTPDGTTALAAKEGRKLLRKAAGLSDKQFSSFASLLDFSECGTDSLFEQEQKAIQTLDRLIEGETRPSHLELHRFISDAMLPASSREPITEEVILSRLEVGTDYALYPCPNRVTPVSKAIERAVARDVVSNLVDGTRRIALHGGAGCGKTTTISQISTMLPPGSVCIQYDCYGGGSYLDDSAPRHRPVEAFTQLSNEIAIRLRVPRLLRISDRGSPVRAFGERLQLGADVLLESNPEALLVVAIDAADNAVAAAARRADHCFVHELTSLEQLPSNVRIVISARTSRLPDLKLPPNFSCQTIEPFSFDETSANVRVHVATLGTGWVKEFHDLTRGVPRVQAYAFELSTDPARAIQFLLPGGKGLGEIFEQAIENAWKKGGDSDSISALCAALISLPRPVPLVELAHTIGSDLPRTTDLCEDLGRTIVMKDGCVSFSDEDFEDFVAKRGAAEQERVLQRIAEHLLENASRNAYAARHVVQSLIAANREEDALRVAIEEPEATLFADPVERRLCHLERMRSALRVCRRTGNPVESMTILLVGAEALRTSDAMAKALAQNPDLSARYARESLDRLVLSDEKYVEANGPVLCHYMAEDARSRSFVQVERSRRLFFAWQSRQVDRRDYRQHSQQLTTVDIAAFCRAEAATVGTDAVLWRLRRFRRQRYDVFTEFVAQVLGQGDIDTIERLFSEPRLPAEARIHVASMLAKAGGRIDLVSISALLTRLQSRKAFLAVGVKRNGRGVQLRKCALDLCELLAYSCTSTDVVRSVLCDIVQGERPRWKHIELSHHARIDEFLRAECLLAELDGRSLIAKHLLDIENKATSGWSSDSGVSYQDHQKQSDMAGLFSAYLPFYQARARYIKNGRLEELTGTVKAEWMNRVKYATYSDSRGRARDMHYRLAESAISLVALGGEHFQELFDVVTELIKTGKATFGSRDAEVLRPFTWRSELHGWLTDFANECQLNISDLRTSSSEKASSLLELSRLLLDCSPHTSASLFSAAVLVLEDVDVNEMRLLGIFDKLSHIASSALEPAVSRKAAVGLASFGTAVAFRLRDYEHFPWSKLSRGLTYLNAPVALAAAARWDDEGLASITEALRVVLTTGVSVGSICAEHAAAFRYLFGREVDGLVSAIVRMATKLDEDTRLTIHEILAECEALARNPNPRLKVDAEIFGGVPAERRGRWLTYLSIRCKFAESLVTAANVGASVSTKDDGEREKISSFVNSLDWTGSSFETASEVLAFTQRAFTKAREEHSLYTVDREVYGRIRALVPAHRHCEHLSQLAELALADDGRYDIAEALADAIVEWYARSMAVRDWCANNLPRIISARLLVFMLPMRAKSLLSMLYEASCIASDSLYKAILAGLAENIEEFDANRIYDLIEMLAGLVTPVDVGIVLTRYIDRLHARVRLDSRFESSDIPECIEGALARLLYAYLSDADLAVRWRAAHGVRGLFWLKASSVLDELVACYRIGREGSFRADGAPFYWLAARLWLTIAVSRACNDRPEYAVRYAGYLLSIVDEEEFPHLLIRMFAKRGVMVLANAGLLRLTANQLRSLSKVDSSHLRKTRRPRELDREDAAMRGGDERRFQFDSLDTLRYWYPGMAQIFADVSLKGFTDEAERWIVDRWSITSNPWKWDEEARKDKFKHNPYAMQHSHGELPRVERFHTHLEWHAMWCATGELLKSHPFAKSEYDDDTLKERLSGATTVAPTIWQSDLRSPKPLEKRFWLVEKVGAKWVHEPSVQEVVELLGLMDARGYCVVYGDYDCYWSNVHESTRVTSCLVSPRTAPALLRALQSSTDIHGHYLPHAGDDEGIDVPPFTLKGWLTQSEGKSGLDSKDDFGGDISPRVMQPGDAVVKTLGLVPSENFIFGWEHKATSDLVFYSEQWGDEISDRRYREDADYVRSKGERLHCKLHAVQLVLEQDQYDLLIKVKTYRKEYEEHRYSESDKGESAYFIRYILLTRHGDISDAAGTVGTWKVSG
ncbi:hypothetical protein PQR34_14460 [Paraburkholderia sediminicola]|uniref:hypothetical protein n=1 Tax=Paraburkholderia sediminicola TaxID=458836 RepID=UPI0038B9FC64